MTSPSSVRAAAARTLRNGVTYKPSARAGCRGTLVVAHTVGEPTGPIAEQGRALRELGAGRSGAARALVPSLAPGPRARHSPGSSFVPRARALVRACRVGARPTPRTRGHGSRHPSPTRRDASLRRPPSHAGERRRSYAQAQATPAPCAPAPAASIGHGRMCDRRRLRRDAAQPSEGAALATPSHRTAQRGLARIGASSNASSVASAASASCNSSAATWRSLSSRSRAPPAPRCSPGCVAVWISLSCRIDTCV